MNGIFDHATRLCAIPFFFLASHGHASSHEPKVGDAFEIIQSYQTSSASTAGGSGSSSGKSALVERVISVDQNGVELEYDEPFEADGKRKGLNWQLPARIYRPKNSTPMLLNAAELEKRVDPWLKEAKMSRAACGQWIFTWSAFKIECDPSSVLGIVEQYNLWSPAPVEGQLYSDIGAMAAVPLKLKSRDSSGSVYVAELEVDPEKVKIEKARSDVVVGQILGKAKTFEMALAEQVEHQITGTISVTIETGPSGQIVKRTKITRLRVGSNGEIETSTNSVRLKRSPQFAF